MTDYKEKYEKAVQAAMLAKQDTESAVTIGILETIFPELKESDGARAKREIIDFLKCCCEKEVVKAIDAANWIAWLEKQVEQKPADKVEPKFEVGDWVVYKNDICQIVKREKGCNKLITVFGIEKELVNERNLSTARHWTIQDAKDGDVLVSSSGKPFIFKGFFDNDPMAYGGLVADDSFWPASNSNWTTVYCKPATKEQRDLLFQKMKEAGYKWDAEKKELKKIEQLTKFEEAVKDLMNDYRDAIGDNDATIEEIKKHSEYLLSLIPQKTAEPILSKEVDSQIWQIANNAGITYDQSISLLMATKKAYDKGKEDAIKEQKPAEWSEYDNEMFLHCCAAIRVADYSSIDDRNMMEKWFRNLKDRVQPQPKQEWSEEDEKYWSIVIAEFSKCAGKSVSKDEWMRCNDWLNSLRDRVQPQPKQEWSEEDEQLYNDLSDTYFYNDEDYPEETYKLMLKRVLDWMTKRAKSLRPQSHWRPSDEQMDALETAASSLQSTTLESLYNELKKL